MSRSVDGDGTDLPSVTSGTKDQLSQHEKFQPCEHHHVRSRTLTAPTHSLPQASAREARVPYSPALDGLRAFAVLAVLAYHAGIRQVPGGLLGVDVFFVLSGFLITRLLIAEPGKLLEAFCY